MSTVHKHLNVAKTERDHADGISMMLPSGTDGMPPFRSLPVTLNSNRHGTQGRVTNSSSETRVNEHPSSTMVLQNEETVPLQSPVHSSVIRLEEESDGECSREVLRRNSSARLHASLSGNLVCHPEQEYYATMAPTLVLAAAEPHVSLDPDKPCCDATLGEHSSVTSETSGLSVSDTFCKSNR